MKNFLPEEESDDMEFDKRENFSSFDDALARVSSLFLRHGVITYINTDNKFNIKLKIDERIKHP